jgi:hypothetical protein
VILMHILYFYNNLVIDTNPQISVHEQGEWIDKGLYTAAVGFDEDIEWIKQKRDYILPVCYVRDLIIFIKIN